MPPLFILFKYGESQNNITAIKNTPPAKKPPLDNLENTLSGRCIKINGTAKYIKLIKPLHKKAIDKKNKLTIQAVFHLVFTNPKYSHKTCAKKTKNTAIKVGLDKTAFSKTKLTPRKHEKLINPALKLRNKPTVIPTLTAMANAQNKEV